MHVEANNASRSERRRLYWRLLAFTKPYRLRLAIGILAGMMSAGTLFVIFDNANDAVASFRSGSSQTDIQRPETLNAELETRNKELEARDKEQGARNTELETRNSKQGTRNKEQGTRNPDDKFRAKIARMEATLGKHGINVKIRNDDDTITWQGLALVLMAIPLLIIIRISTSVLNHYYMRWVGAAVVRDLRDAIFATLQRQSLKYYGRIDVGELISRCVNDTASIEHVVSSTIANAARAPFEILAVLVWAAKYSVENGIGRFVLSLAVFLPLCVLPVIILGQRVKRWTKKSLERISFVVSRMHENFTGIRVVKAFNTEAQEEARFRKLNNDYFRAVVKTFRAEIFMSPLMEAVIAVIGMAFVVACFVLKIDLVKIAMVATAIYLTYKPLKDLAQINAWLQRGAAALQRIFSILDTDTSLPEPSNPVSKRDFTDRIVFDHVSFAFSADGPEVVHDATFEVPRGSLVALVGETGSGKSTYANLLARFYDPSSGSVTLDGIDLRQIATPELRSLIGVVTQDTILFNDTIAANIAYGTDGASMDDIVAAAKMANAHEFIIAHPDGYQRVCGDKGFLLSGGEKQRIALARAILRNPPILILDEATSALDTVTERLVQDAIAKVMASRTTLAIAHRLSTVHDASLILVIDKGRIVERGTHDQLYAAGGRYRRLCDMQLAG